MKKTIRIIVFIASIFLAIIVVLFVFIISNPELMFGKPYGPYHHEALITIPTKVVTVGQKRYTWFDREIYLIDDNNIVLSTARIPSDDRNIIGINDITTDGENLIVAALNAKNGLTVFSSDLKYKETLVSSSVRSALVAGDYIYYFRSNSAGEYFELRCFNRITRTDSFVSERFSNDTVTINGVTIYANYKGNLYTVADIDKVNQANDYILNETEEYGFNYHSQTQLGFCYNGTTGRVSVADGRITLVYDGKNYELDCSEISYLYNRIVINDHKLFFAEVDYKQNDNCIYDYCICHVGGSRLISFDFVTKTFNIENVLNENEYYISFGEGFVSHYSDGKLYRNGENVASVSTIKPQGEFMLYGKTNRGGTTKITRSVFFDTGSEIFYRFDDYSYLLKNEVW